MLLLSLLGSSFLSHAASALIYSSDEEESCMTDLLVPFPQTCSMQAQPWEALRNVAMAVPLLVPGSVAVKRGGKDKTKFGIAILFWAGNLPYRTAGCAH